MRTSAGEWAANPASASASPPVSSSGGKIPWASARNDTVASRRAPLDLVEHAGDRRRIGGQQRPRQLDLHRDRGELGLRAVVQVALQAAALGVGHRHQPGARRAQLVVAPAEVVDRPAQLAVELGVVQHGGDEPGDAGQRFVVAVVEVLGTRVAVHHQQADQRTLDGERGDAHRPAATVQHRQPRVHPPGAGHTGAPDHARRARRPSRWAPRCVPGDAAASRRARPSQRHTSAAAAAHAGRRLSASCSTVSSIGTIPARRRPNCSSSSRRGRPASDRTRRDQRHRRA